MLKRCMYYRDVCIKEMFVLKGGVCIREEYIIVSIVGSIRHVWVSQKLIVNRE